MASFDTIVTQLRMLGVGAYSAGARQAARATRDIGYASEEAGAKSALLKKGAIGAKSALMGVATGAGYAVTALGLLTAYGAKVGLEFDSNIERAQIGMETLLHDTGKATKLVADVTTFAAKAPLFGIEEMQQAAQQLVGVGMKAEKVVPTLKTFSDTLSALGRRPEDLLRMRYAFTQMMSKGTVSAEELRGQLGEIFPAMKILAREMGITTGQLRKKMKEGAVGSKNAIQLLLRGMNEDFGGATQKMNKTFYGQMQNIKENARLVLGQVFKPLFELLRDSVFPWVRKISAGIGQWAKKGGPQQFISDFKSGFAGISMEGEGVNEWAVRLGKAFKWVKDLGLKLWDAMEPAKPFLDNVLIPLAAGFGVGLIKGIESAIPVLKVFFQILGFIGNLAKPLRPVFFGIGFVLGYIIGPAKILGPIFKGVGLLFGLVFKAGSKVLGLLTKFSPAFNKLIDLGLTLFFKWKAFWGKIVGLYIKGVGKIVQLIVGLGTKLGSAVVSVVKTVLSKMGAIVSGFRTLGQKALDAIVNVFKKGASGAAAVGAAIANAAINFIEDAINSIDKIGPISVPDITLPRFASGTSFAPGGMAMVGERGPELVSLPRGARVIPTHALSGWGQASFSGAFAINNNVFLDGKLVSRSVAQHTQDQMARR